MLEWLTQMHTAEGIRAIVAAGGLIALIAIIFAETGLLAGFFLPGDSLLVAAGVFCALDPAHPGNDPLLDLRTTMVALCIAAILGDWVNFWFGKLTGNRIWQRPDGRFFKRRYLEEAQSFYARWGGMALAAARFVPVARTFVPFAAGMARMHFASFLGWNIAGAVAWVVSLVTLGYLLGQNEYMRHRLHLVILVVVGVSVLPIVIGVLKRLFAVQAAKAAANATKSTAAGSGTDA
ncbi:MAG: VTT domain-containing protein [Planctomycetes bacterium]|nr:VTT domain-containing protein [Planctomycetota bacterium]